jgi:hypothetical protein
LEQTNFWRQSGTRFGAISSSHPGGIGFDLMPATLAPRAQPDLAAAAAPSAIGGPGSEFTGVAAVPGAELVLAPALRVSAVAPVAVTAVLLVASRGCEGGEVEPGAFVGLPVIGRRGDK